MPQVEVAFDIDANGILNVSAKDLGTGKEQRVTITASTHLDQSQVERMVREAEQHADEDEQRREEIEARNRADSLVYGTEKGLSEYGDKIGEEEKSQIETALNELKTALKEEEADISRIRELTQALEQASYKMAEAMYKDVGQQAAAGEGPPPGEAPGGGPGDAPGSETRPAGDDVVDAEFRSSDDDGKK